MNILLNKLVLLSVLALMIQGPDSDAQTKAEINLNVKHVVGGISEFDREKFVTVHSSLTEGDWDGEADNLDYLINDLDVHFGRDNGIMILYMNKAGEDPAREGYADPVHMESLGKYHRETYYGSHRSDRHLYDSKNDTMIGGQPRAFWSGTTHEPGRGKRGWELGGADAAGEYMGRFLNAFYREDGQSAEQGPARPKYIEILNEPLYELIDGHKGSTVKPLDVFEYHNKVAAAIRRVNDTTLIGGYTTAFPIFEERDFARWDERMKLFIDTSGEHMDFFSIHLYDFNDRHYKGRDYYKGGRVEATLDMIEQYSRMRLGEVRPFIISEYGGRDHDLEREAWSPLRDWSFIKAFSPLMLSFMDRPNQILKSLPFIVVKAEWGRNKGLPYTWRLLRQAKEGEGETGEEWVFTEQIKFYELWSDVKGSRIRTKSTNPDVLMDSYVDGNKAYVILSNLNPSKETVDLKLLNRQKPGLRSIKVKHLYLAGDAPVLDVAEQNEPLKSFTLAQEATAIIEYTFDSDIVFNQVAEETKHYATDYNQPIVGRQSINFEIIGVKADKHDEAVLRIGFGREKDRSRQPKVLFNGQPLNVPKNYCGSEQNIRDAFFGMLEIEVPQNLLKANNRISITFPDSGGRVSSVALKHIQMH